LPRYLPIVFAFAGDSTTTKLLAMLIAQSEAVFEFCQPADPCTGTIER